jgi:hypothetical protein
MPANHLFAGRFDRLRTGARSYMFRVFRGK